MCGKGQSMKANKTNARTAALLTRTDIVNPRARIPFSERLAQAGAIDLRDNQRTIVKPSGFVEIVPIDKTKKFKR